MLSLRTPRGVLHVHHLVTQAEEVLTHDRLREEVGDILVSWNEGDTQLTILDTLADEVVAPLDVLRLGVVLRIIGEVDGRSDLLSILSGGGSLTFAPNSWRKPER